MESTTVKSLQICGVFAARLIVSQYRSTTGGGLRPRMSAGLRTPSPPPYLPHICLHHWNHWAGQLQRCDWIFVVTAACQKYVPCAGFAPATSLIVALTTERSQEVVSQIKVPKARSRPNPPPPTLNTVAALCPGRTLTWWRERPVHPMHHLLPAAVDVAGLLTRGWRGRNRALPMTAATSRWIGSGSEGKSATANHSFTSQRSRSVILRTNQLPSH
jgi:hypothetical protein